MMKNDAITNEMTYELRGYIFDVRNELKAGWSEQVYHHVLERHILSHGLPVVSKPRRAFMHRGEVIHVFEPDLIVWDKVILELKVLPYSNNFSGEHFAQLIHYLKFFKKELGFLVNFAPANVRIKRVIWSEKKGRVIEDYQEQLSRQSQKVTDVANGVRDAIIEISESVGLGYSDALYRKIVKVELRHRGYTIHDNIEVPARWHEKIVAFQRMPFIRVNENVLVHACSLSGYPSSYEFTRVKTALRNLGIPFAFLVNFGFRQLQIFGVEPK